MTQTLDNLPDVVFAQTGSASIESRFITQYEQKMGVTLYPADPMRQVIATLAGYIAQQNAVFDWGMHQEFVKTATGAFLDNLGGLLNVYRFQPTPATTTLRFEVDEPLEFPVVITKGTRATADSKLFFATDETVTLPIGWTFVEVTATCMTAGVAGNGMVWSQINKLVDPVPYIKRVLNVFETAGGTKTESDDYFRERVRLAPQGFTTAGSEKAYIFWAMSAHPEIQDVKVETPGAGVVNLYVVLKGNRIPYDYVNNEYHPAIQAIKDILVDKRPLTDKVEVLPVAGATFDYKMYWWLMKSQADDFYTIEENVKQAVRDWEEWQVAVLGRDFNPNKLVSMCLSAGAKRIKLVSPWSSGDDEYEFGYGERGITVAYQYRQDTTTDDRVIFKGFEDE